MMIQKKPFSLQLDVDSFMPVSDEEKAVISKMRPSSTFLRDGIKRLLKNKVATISLILIVLITLASIILPLVWPYSYDQMLGQTKGRPMDNSYNNLAPFQYGKTELKRIENGESVFPHIFGTDAHGRDYFIRVVYGTRISLNVGFFASIIVLVIGMMIGSIAGYFGGKVDMVMQRFVEVANSIPRLVICTLLLLVLKPGMVTIIFALMLTEWVGMSRIARAEMLKLKEQEFVLASRTLGAGSFFIIFKEVLPNIIGPIITQVMFSIPTAIFTEAFLSFVGLGIPVPQCSLGSLISDGFNSFTTHPYQIIPPIVVMALLMLSFNLVADGLREALDPKMKEM